MKIGLIGAGNMASALLGGMLNAKIIQPGDAVISDMNEDKLKTWQKIGVKVTTDNKETERLADILILAVKPNVMERVLNQLTGDKNKIYVSIAAGITLSYLEKHLGADQKIVRTMPNTPAQVGCGMTVVVPNDNLDETEKETVLSLLQSVGMTLCMTEKELDIAIALHSSSPAYIYMLIDAMADAGVRYGLTKENALKLAAKAVEGSAKMVLETGIHPEQLKDNVCSPGGTTIAAVCELERTGFRTSIQSGIDACIRRNREMQQ